jgi:hypothetical protein
LPSDESTTADPVLTCAVAPITETSVPPPPWDSWQQVREFADALAEHRFLLARRPDHLTEEDQTQLAALLATPAAAPLRTARAFLEEWYAIWRDEQGRHRRPEDAWCRYRAWRANGNYVALPHLKRVVERIDERRFAKLSHFLDRPDWEATNNGAERMGRLFRHRQASHFRLRAAPSIEDSLRSWAVNRRDEVKRLDGDHAARARRGRTPRNLAAMSA